MTEWLSIIVIFFKLQLQTIVETKTVVFLFVLY